MANALATQILVDGARNVVVKAVGTLDTSDLAVTDLVAPASFTPVPTTFKIDKIQYSVEPGITVRLWWDATTDVYIAALSGSNTLDARPFGGIQNNSTTGTTGKIQVSTEGYSSGTEAFTLTLEMSKIGC